MKNCNCGTVSAILQTHILHTHYTYFTFLCDSFLLHSEIYTDRSVMSYCQLLVGSVDDKDEYSLYQVRKDPQCPNDFLEHSMVLVFLLQEEITVFKAQKCEKALLHLQSILQFKQPPL